MKWTVFALVLLGNTAIAQSVNVENYRLKIQLYDTTDVFSGQMQISFLLLESVDTVYFDLTSKNESGQGMTVRNVTSGKRKLGFRHANDRLAVFPVKAKRGEKMVVEIRYDGVPDDGLIIGKNKFDDRTFFGDNWPNRAHHWFPCVDHPSDKARISFSVEAPAHYSVVSVGAKKEVKDTLTNRRITRFESATVLPTKVMVIGVADLVAMKMPGDAGFEHVNYVYPQNEQEGFKDMSVSNDPLVYFSTQIGPYPFEKLYNVQSTTRYGGMENAGCIFYDENAVTGQEKMENLIAHEIAHQWFGNSVTEKEWSDLWLSEGFATYFTHLYIENKYGLDKMNEQLKKDRMRVIQFFQKYQTPVVDTLSTDLNYLLNPNSYQKGAWVLHMLRNKIGEEVFWRGIRSYYQQYKFQNADTEDFQQIIEKEYGASLSSFFDQWLKRTGHPVIQVVINSDRTACKIVQMQKTLFDFPLEMEVEYGDGTRGVISLDVSTKSTIYTSENKSGIRKVKLDPNVKLLFQNATDVHDSNRN